METLLAVNELAWLRESWAFSTHSSFLGILAFWDCLIQFQTEEWGRMGKEEHGSEGLFVFFFSVQDLNSGPTP
jgi:hypothetical protein